jgi:hypothetical protein
MSLSLEIIQHGSWFLHSYISMSVCRPALTEACMRGNFDTIRATGNWVIAKSVGCLSIRAAGCYWVKAQSFGCLSVSAQQVVTGTSTGSKCNRLDDSLPEEPKSQRAKALLGHNSRLRCRALGWAKAKCFYPHQKAAFR